jgi:ubiquinone/menaquinone biosynthesis C-methylase UbiE
MQELSGRTIPYVYTDLQAAAHDYLIGERALNLHAYILQVSGLADLLAEPTPRTMLDVGCGGGQSAIRLKERHPHLQLTGMDLSADQIIRARGRARRKGVAVSFEIADAEALPYRDAAFDIVYSFGSAKHWPEPVRGFSECWRVLRPGGELLVADATCDATREQVENFYAVAGFPGLLQKPVAGLLYERMFRPARPLAYYREVAAAVGMPPDTVSQLPGMPAFLFRARKGS